MTSTYTSTTTRTHTATHITDVIMGAIADILADLGIDLTTLYRDWTQDENAISAWILEGSLKEVVLECHQPRGTVAPVIEFPIAYKASGTGDSEFTASRARLARFRAKLDRVPAGTTYRLFCTFNGPRTPQPGWSPGARASTQGLRSINYGTLGSAPDASTSMRYLYR
jgi:Bacterial HORMA domain 2